MIIGMLWLKENPFGTLGELLIWLKVVLSQCRPDGTMDPTKKETEIYLADAGDPVAGKATDVEQDIQKIEEAIKLVGDKTLAQQVHIA